MKFLKIFFVFMMFFLPCLYYNPSGVFSLGYQVTQVMEVSYSSLIDGIYKIWS